MRRPCWSRTFMAAFGVWLVLGLTWAVASPLYSVPDEPAHVVRAASVAGGQLLGEQRVVEVVGPPLIRRVEHVVEVPTAYQGADAGPACFAATTNTADCSVPLQRQPGTAPVSTTAGAYQPLFYALTGLPLRVLSPVEGMYGARAIGAALGALLLAAAFATAWDLGGRLFMSVLALAVTPVVPYLIGSVNPNGIEVASAVALWMGSLALLLRAQTRYAVMAAASLAVLSWTRPLSPAIAVGILLVVLAAAATPTRIAALGRSRHIGPLAVGVAALAGAGWWLWYAGALDAFVGAPSPQLTGRAAAQASLAQTLTRAEQLVGTLGWIDTRLPGWLVIAWGLSTLAVVVLAMRQGWWRDRLVLLAMIAATILFPVAAEVRKAADLGLFWQGRYTLPVAAGVAVLAGWILSRTDRLEQPLARVVVNGIAVLAAVGHLTAHVVSIRRYSTGPGTAVLAYVWRPGWSAPVPDVPLLIAAVVGSLGLLALLVLVDDHGRDSTVRG